MIGIVDLPGPRSRRPALGEGPQAVRGDRPARVPEEPFHFLEDGNVFARARVSNPGGHPLVLSTLDALKLPLSVSDLEHERPFGRSARPTISVPVFNHAVVRRKIFARQYRRPRRPVRHAIEARVLKKPPAWARYLTKNYGN